MTRFRKPKIAYPFLIAAAVVAIAGFALCMATADIQEREYKDLQLRAAVRMEKAEAYLKERILAKGGVIEPEDLNKTALMGPEFSEIVTTPGNEDAKRTSLNPNFAAAMVRWFTEAGVEEGDTIAIGTSGSFPGLMIASLCAATEMNVRVSIIASCGASMHGATRIEYPIFEYLRDLREGGFAEFDLIAVSGGGDDDHGSGLYASLGIEGTEEIFDRLCLEACTWSGAEYIKYDSLTDSIRRRLELYPDDVKLFINIGGASANSGSSSYTLNFPQGLVMPEDAPKIPSVANKGLNYEYAERNVPVLNLLNVKLLASENDIAYDAVPMQKAGESGVYAVKKYNRVIIIATLLLEFLVLAAGVMITRGCRPWLPGNRRRSSS
ncbi:MAG: poly-gamma-glutamate system protein [Spirochaetales bacterium]|nr:poly-gamma-glutamate system protein [Spirochaetales bacterium]